MPTPNLNSRSDIAETPDLDSDVVASGRPARIQLACPEETSNSNSVTAVSWLREEEREDTPATTADSPCPLDAASPATLASEDEKAYTAVASPPPPPTPAATADVPSTTKESPASSAAPSPRVSQKIFSTRRASSGTGCNSGVTSSLLDCPFAIEPDTGYSTKRVLPSYTSSFLRPGSKFVGKQKSDRSTYEVHVELKHVNMAESFLCGYLRIKGLTEDHPTLTTYFEGEMIGDKYTFQTRRPEWGSSEKNDLAHWQRFPAFRPLVGKAKRQEFSYRGFAQKENIFMRWKEYFLVPDHRVRQISGASFEGFYYICFNQVSGTVDGIYFHAKSEKFQKLQLEHVPERTFACMEFR